MIRESAAKNRSKLAQKGFFHSLRSKMLVYFGMLFTLSTAVLIYVNSYGIPFTSFGGEHGVLQSEVFRQLDLVADLKKERLMRWIKERGDDTAVLADNRVLGAYVVELCTIIQEKMDSGMDSDELWTAIQSDIVYQVPMRLLYRIRAAYGVYENIQIADASTGIVIVATRDTDLGVNVSGEDYFSEALSIDKSYTNIRECPQTGKIELFVSHVVKAVKLTDSDEDKPHAVVIMHINPDDFIVPMLHTGEGLGETGEALLVNREVKILTPLKHLLPNGTEAQLMEYQIQAKAAVFAAGGKEGIIMTQDYRGVSVLAAYRHIRISSELRWGMVVKRDVAEVFAPRRDIMLYSLMIGLVSIGAMLILAYVIATRLSLHIRLLSQTAQQVESGDLNARVPETRTSVHEVSILSGAFNSMIQRIQNWYQELDQQVRVRTTELREQTYTLDQRVKELNCLYGISRLIQTPGASLEEILDGAVKIIPLAWQYPKSACARITVRDQEFKTENFHDTHWRQSSDVMVYGERVGSVEVYYLEERRKRDEGPFLNEERDLLDAIAERLANVIEQKQAEKELRESEERFALAVKGAADGIWDWNITTNDLWLAPRFKELLGYQDHEFASTFDNWELHLHPDDRRLALEAISAHQERRVPYDMEYRLKTKSGQYRWYRARGQAIWDEDGVPYRMSGSIQDITERKRAVEQLRKLNEELEQRVAERTSELEAANAELKDFAYIVSHDLKAPLRAISQLANWILQDYSHTFDEAGREQIDLLIGRAKRMDNLIEGILQYSRIGRIKGDVELIDFNEFVRDEVAMISPPDHIQIIIEGELPSIICDRTRIGQVFQNLLGNAVKFMDKSRGEIMVKCTDNGSHWKFSVADNGPGIDERYHQRVFQIFQTLTSRDRRESTGIGLTIVKKIVELHGGEIWLESEVEVGTTFHFTLPKEGIKNER